MGEDSLGNGLIASGFSKETIAKWSEDDAQVSVEREIKDGKTMRVYVTLEDLNADTSLTKVAKICK